MLTSTGTTDQYESELVITSNWTEWSRTIGISIQRQGYVSNKLKRLARKAGLFWGMSLKGEQSAPADRCKQAVRP